jgi:hypothetical protein
MNRMLRDVKLLRAVNRFDSELTQGGTINMTKFIPSVVTLVLTAASLFSTEIQTFVAGHATIATVIAGVYALIKGLLPSPLQTSSAVATK